jgi:hypothetical protein
MKPGTRISFLKTIGEGPDDYAPSKHFCTKGDLGTVKEDYTHIGGRTFDYSVYWDGWTSASFCVMADEIEAVDE